MLCERGGIPFNIKQFGAKKNNKQFCEPSLHNIHQLNAV